MADRFGDSSSVLIESLKDNAKKQKHKIKYKQLAESLEDLGERKRA